jgi:hypothetical protein
LTKASGARQRGISHSGCDEGKRRSSGSF